MVEQIVKMVVAELKKAIERFAIEKQSDETDIQIAINPQDNEATPEYHVLFKYNPDKKITFKELIGVKVFDIKNREMFVKPFLQKSFLYISKKENIDLFAINIMAMKTVSGNVVLLLYKHKKFIFQINLDYIMQGLDEYENLINT